MYGRNELVARYIKIRTGKIRSRKQVSSHLQVLAKRRSKELQELRNDKQAQKIILDRLKQYTSAEIVSLSLEDQQNALKPTDILTKSLNLNKTQSHSISNNEYSNTRRRSSTNIGQLKLNDDDEILASSSSNNILASLESTQLSGINKSTTKILTSNMINNSIPHFVPSK